MGLWFSGNDNPDVPTQSVVLMLEVREGCEKAFAELYALYHRRLLDFFYGLGRDRHTASDLCQETFLRIWRLRKKYAATGSFPAYLFTIARNIWLEHCRTLTKRSRLGTPFSIDQQSFRLPESRLGLPRREARRSELQASIAKALQQLPQEQRMVIVLRLIEGFSLEETASIMNCPINTVRSRKILAFQKLRVALKEVVDTMEL